MPKPSGASVAAARPKAEQVRNTARLARANRDDEGTIGKCTELGYLPNDVSKILVSKLQDLDDWFRPPNWLLANLKEVAGIPVRTPLRPPIHFDTTPEAIAHNTDLLFQHNLDFVAMMHGLQETTAGYNSEFRPIGQLRSILGDHPNFYYIEELADKGMEYKFTRELSEKERKSELTAMIGRGNHKSAEEAAGTVAKLLQRDVHHGFSFPFRASVVPTVPNAMVQPCGLVRQHTLQEDGSRAEKSRLTQDLSISSDGRKLAVNERIDLSAYPDMIYGWCLLRVLHFVVALRLANPGVRIFISKWDFSDAYRRVTHAAQSALQSIVIFGEIAYLALRLTFGGSANPPAWCAFSEMVTDLSNEIALCDDFDPATLASPDHSNPTFRELPDDVPVAEAREIAVPIPTTLNARFDCFIDDIIQVFLDSPENRRRQPAIVPLAVFATLRPHAGDDEPVPRRPLLSPTKVAAEGAPAEIQIVLGWEVNTRRLLIGLPNDKFVAWLGDITDTLKLRRITFADLESLVGRINHASFVIPLSRHFIYRLRRRTNRHLHPKQHVTLSETEIQDLKLWQRFLRAARDGISMNRVVTRQPNRMSISDSCPHGLGGFLLSGRAWRLRIPPASPLHGDSTMNNVLEFLAMAISIWLQVLESDTHEDCILALADSTSAIGWLYRCGHLGSDSIYYEAANFIARTVARIIINSHCCLASQHLKGDFNVVADLLSFTHQVRGSKTHPIAADEPPDDVLTLRFHTHFAQIVPPGFAICPLPSDVLSFAIRALRIAESSLTQNKNPQTRNGTESGAVGPTSAPTRDSKITDTSVTFPSSSATFSSAHFWPSTAPDPGASRESFLASVDAQWLQTLSAKPQASWLRRFGAISNKAPCTSRTATSCFPPFDHSSAHSTISTPRPTGRKP